MPRRSNGGDRGNSYDRRERKLWLIGAKSSVKYGQAPFGGDGCHVDCVHCGKPLTIAELTADRILPGSMGGTYRWDNVQPSCLPCNASRGDTV
jgi:5-methylcytosine-specific restriction endonuclease McrA